MATREKTAHPPPIRPKALKRSAYHEAGHAIIGRHKGTVCLVTLERDPDVPRRKGLTVWGANDSPTYLSDYAMVLLAGPRAAAIGAHIGYAGALLDGGCNDTDKAQELAEEVAGSTSHKVSPRALLDLWNREVKAMLRAEWPAVEAVTKELLRKRKLTGSDVLEIYFRVMDPFAGRQGIPKRLRDLYVQRLKKAQLAAENELQDERHRGAVVL